MKKIKKLFMGLIFLLFCLSACSKGADIENKDNTANEETKKNRRKISLRKRISLKISKMKMTSPMLKSQRVAKWKITEGIL